MSRDVLVTSTGDSSLLDCGVSTVGGGGTPLAVDADADILDGDEVVDVISGAVPATEQGHQACLAFSLVSLTWKETCLERRECAVVRSQHDQRRR